MSDDAPLSTADRVGLLAFRDSVWHAWFAGDADFLMRALPADFRAIPMGEDTAWATRAQTVAESKEFAASGGKLVRLEFPRNEILIYGSTTIVLTRYVMETENGGERRTSTGRATEVFVRKDGQWIHPSWHLDSGK